jgi:hypothetical protein
VMLDQFAKSNLVAGTSLAKQLGFLVGIQW